MRMLDLDQYLKMILRAPVYDVARETPLDLMPGVSRRLHNQVWMKREDMQPVFSYKIRGAYNMISALTAEERARGVITASAGNHAQGVALAAGRLGIAARIVMPPCGGSAPRSCSSATPTTKPQSTPTSSRRRAA
jgi:threonine dehydratase